MSEPIPHIIHYCWFGRKPLPKLARKCIDSWRRYLPGWEIREWNEDNFDIDSVPYTAEAYRAGKYAFVSDYARFAILYQYGGVYLDTDVEMIRSWEPLIDQAPFVGVEQSGMVATGLGMAMPSGNSFCKEMVNTYSHISFVLPDGSFNMKTVCDYTAGFFESGGFKASDKSVVINGITIFPPQVLSPKSQIDGKIEITPATYAIHHYAGSWLTPWERFKLKIKGIVGPRMASVYINLKKRITNGCNTDYNKSR